MLTEVAHAIGERVGRQNGLVAALQPVYARYLEAVCGRRGLPWHINGEPLRIHPSTRHLLPHENEPALFAFLREQVMPGQFVLDIGAFLGSYAILEARRVGPEGRVLAFEPSPSTFALLQRHLAMNGLRAPQAEARCAAVGAVVGQRSLMTWDDEPYRNQVAPDGVAGVPVRAVTLDDVLATEARLPDWIRMDVQGQEFDVLRGARELIHATRGALRIVVETHPDQWPDYGVAPADAHDVFASLGLRARPLVAGEPLFVQSGHAILETL